MTTETPTSNEILGALSKAQRRAVEHDAGPLAVLAGPGAGKTRVIVSRVARLALPVAQGGAGADPESVVALAFTIKSAQEMRDRLASMLGGGLAGRLRVGTCHSFGRSILSRFGDVLGLPASLRVMDSAVQRRTLRALTLEHDLFAHRRGEGIESSISEAIGFISQCQNAAIEAPAVLAWCEREGERLASGEGVKDEKELAARRALLTTRRDMARLFELYDRARLPAGRITLDDYIALPVRILRRSEMASAIVRDETRHIVVDEFQDWNPAQIELLRLLAPTDSGASPPDVCVVGDDDQAIYAFRGADDRAFARFEEIWPGAEIVRLDLNYRSAEPVVDAARVVIEGADERFAPDKVIRASDAWKPSRGGDPGVEGVLVADDAHVGSAIGAMIRSDRATSQRAYGDYAVLARSNGTRDAVVSALEILGIPVIAKRRLTPLDDPAVRDLLAWMRLLAGIESDAHTQRLLASATVGGTVDEISAWRREHLRECGLGERDERSFIDWLGSERASEPAVGRFLETLGDLRTRVAGKGASGAAREIITGAALVASGGLAPRDRAARVARLAHVISFIEQCEPDLEEPGGVRAFLDHYADLSDEEQAFARSSDDAVDRDEGDDDRPDAVAVLTAHSAKGLEFDTVFVARVRPGRAGFPSRQPREESLLPDELSGRAPGSVDDEERRLFYVACTRAERRLVLLAKEKKTRGKGDYFIELEDALGFPVSDAADWMSRADVTPPDGLTDDESAARLDIAAERARDAGVLALRDAEREGLSEGELDAIRTRLSDAAERLAMIAHLRRTGAMHETLKNADPERAAEILAHVKNSGDGLRPLRAPLSLSYSFINAYQRCPACFYVRHVLGFSEEKTPKLTIGNAVHAALETFYVETRDAEADGVFPPGKDRLLELGEQRLRSGWPAATPVEPDAFSQVRSQLETFWDQMHDPSAEILLLEGQGHGGARVRPFAYPYRGDHTMIAKLDRVDRLPDGGFRIIDYKTGAATKKLLEPAKNDLQLSIYAMALQEHLELEEPPRGTAEYWVVATGQRGVIDLGKLDLEKARAKINAAIDGMLDGRYDRTTNTRECSGLCAVLG